MPNGDSQKRCESVFCQDLSKGISVKANKLRPGKT